MATNKQKKKIIVKNKNTNITTPLKTIEKNDQNLSFLFAQKTKIKENIFLRLKNYP